MYLINIFRFPIEVIRLLNYESVRGMMFYQMIKKRGPIPEDLQEFSRQLEILNLESLEGIYRGTVIGHDGSAGLIFASDTMINACRTGNDFAMDGTFNVIIFN